MDAGYDELIMDHIRNARNYRVLDDANRHATGMNPLCGDEVVVSVRLEDDRIADVTFQCTCCGISMASASMMTAIVRGKSAEEAQRACRDMVALLKASDEPDPLAAGAEGLALRETIRKFPARTRCALLPWATFEGALDKPGEVVAVY
ncbi:MAG TPA: SUF system NifU family Fe-S cluster assembly protein [Burkholderiales bacterium]|nr:SUF system NifU family Fe-S cluster assembly protein [Burkholderiales bacterium]